jgi:hypothetical protein
MAVELKNRIAVDLKVNVPVVKFLQGFSVDQAVAQVLDQLATEAANPTTPLAPAVAQPAEQQNAERLLADLDQLSDEQVVHCSPICWLRRRMKNDPDRPANCRSFTR